MAQNDMNIANQGFPGFRADLNDALGALVSNSSGATAPATTFAHQFWVDTSANPSILKVRNADNDAFITIGEIDQTGDKFNLKCANATILENLTVNAQGDVRFADSDSSHFIAFQAPATVTSNVTFTLPAADGTNGQVIQTNGSGTLSFATAGGALTGTTDSASPFETSLGTGAGAVNTGGENTFIGFDAGNDNTSGVRNTAIGTNALATVTTANENTAVGFNALAVSTVGDSVAVGSSALQANTTGTENTGLGAGALKANTTAANNTAVGRSTLNVNTTGANNTAVGREALLSNTTGEKNTAVGSAALDACTTGFLNTALGFNALGSVTTGLGNIAIGDEAGQGGVNLTTGNDNTLIGRAARTSTGTSSNQIVIGTNLTGTGNNEVTIGSSAGKIHNAYTVNATWTQTSDERLKKNIQEDTLGLSFINRLRPVKYQWKPSNEIDPSLPYYDEVNRRNTQAVMHGLVAQEVKSALDAEGVTTFAGWSVTPDMIQGISREMFVSPLIKAIQELSAQVTALQAEVKTLKGQP